MSADTPIQLARSLILPLTRRIESPSFLLFTFLILSTTNIFAALNFHLLSLVRSKMMFLFGSGWGRPGSSLSSSISAMSLLHSSILAFQLPVQVRITRILNKEQSSLFYSPHEVRRHRDDRKRCLSLALKMTSKPISSPPSTLLEYSPSGWINSDKIDLSITLNNDNEENDGFTKTQSTFVPPASSVDTILIRDRLVYIKRDDSLRLPSSYISGNKARKFFSLNTIPAEDFPDAIVSYGGPQSNAMVALAAIVSSKNAEIKKKKKSGENTVQGDDVALEVESKNMFWELDVLEDNVLGNIKRKKLNSHLSEMFDSLQISSELNATTPASISSECSSAANSLGTVKSPKSSSPSKKRFIYYTKPLPRYLRKYPNGNLLRALALGMEIKTLSQGDYTRLFGGLHGGSSMAPADLDPPVPGRSLWMPQGGACSVAKQGSDLLAKEIIDYWSSNGKGIPLAVCVPGGTCTTGLLLHRSLNNLMQHRKVEGKEALDISVVVIPCVGDDSYALRQMMSLDKAVGGTGKKDDMPDILIPKDDRDSGVSGRKGRGYFTFGEPKMALLRTFDEMNESGLYLDLLYGAPAWTLLLQHWRSRDSECPISGRQVMYVHSGGLEGIASQLTRYKHKGLMDARTIQPS